MRTRRPVIAVAAVALLAVSTGAAIYALPAFVRRVAIARL
jgi:hypothetical protein